MSKKRMRFNQKKYEELICYIINRCQPCLDLYKIQEIVRVADFNSFASTGTPMTGETYRKAKDHIAGDHFVATIKKLFKSGKLVYVKTIIAPK